MSDKKMEDGLLIENWKEDHLNYKHKKNYDWCPLCVARSKNNVGGDLSISVNDDVKSVDKFG